MPGAPRGEGLARVDAVARRAASGTSDRGRRRSSCWKSRTARCGDRAQIEEGLRPRGRGRCNCRAAPSLTRCRRRIAALHAQAPNYQDTDWKQIAGLYEVLLRISPSPVIELNHAAAVLDGRRAGARRARPHRRLAGREARLDGYELLSAVRADLLRRLGPKPGGARGLSCGKPPPPQLEPLRRPLPRGDWRSSIVSRARG